MVHVPVLLNEVLEWLQLKPGKFIVDGTVGSGGHGLEIIKRISPGGIFLGLDWDGTAIEKNEVRIMKYASKIRNLILRVGNYAELPEILKEEKLGKADGLLLDLGFSSEHLDSGRGFSFDKDEPLLMTYNEGTPPAYQVLNQLSQTQLERILREYSNERYARRVAGAIREREKKGLVRTSRELAEVIRQVLPSQYERGRIDPATRTFMALRIYANDELGNLERLLEQIPRIIRAKGRVIIISFHSLEDRLVKQYFRALEKAGKAKILTKKPITASEEEIEINPRSRSAKLRAIEMT